MKALGCFVGVMGLLTVLFFGAAYYFFSNTQEDQSSLTRTVEARVTDAEEFSTPSGRGRSTRVRIEFEYEVDGSRFRGSESATKGSTYISVDSRVVFVCTDPQQPSRFVVRFEGECGDPEVMFGKIDEAEPVR